MGAIARTSGILCVNLNKQNIFIAINVQWWVEKYLIFVA